MEEFLIIPNSYFHTMRIFMSYGCVLLLHFTLFVCPMFFSYNVLIKSIYLFLYLFIFCSSLLFTNVSHFHLVKICFNQLEHTFPSLCILHYVLIYNLKKKLNHIHNIHKRNGQIDLSFNYNMYTKKYWSSWIPEKWSVLYYDYKYHQCHFNMYSQYHRR